MSSPQSAPLGPLDFAPYATSEVMGDYRMILQPMTPEQARDLAQSPPTSTDAIDWSNYGSALYVCGRDEEALTAASYAVNLHRNSLTLLNLAIILEGQERFMDALTLFHEAYRLDQNNVMAGGGYADGLLRLGRWDVGWPLYAAYHSRQYVVVDRIPTLSDLKGKRVLVFCDANGAGDTIYHFRWLRHLREAGAHITLAGNSPLMSLFVGHSWVDRIIAPPQRYPVLEWSSITDFPTKATDTSYRINLREFDIFLSMMTLAAVVRPTLEPSIWPGTYLKAKSRRWSRRTKIGVCWKAGEGRFPRAHRTLDAVQVDKLLATRPTQEWNNLTYDEFIPNAHNVDMGNWADTARGIAACDLIVSVDTGVAHLAGALGKPTYVILPGASAWYYGLGDEYRFSYPTMTVFRNGGPGIESALGKCIEEVRCFRP